MASQLPKFETLLPRQLEVSDCGRSLTQPVLFFGPLLHCRSYLSVNRKLGWYKYISFYNLYSSFDMASRFLLPVVLIHGYTDVPVLTGSWRLIERFLREMGVEFFTPQIPPHGSIDERSTSLIRQIRSRYGGRTVHLFGHSMGGINARDIASRAMTTRLGFQISTVTTFGTPHRGVRMINFAPAMPSAVGRLLRSIIGSDLGAFGNLTHRFMRNYNNRTAVNNPSVRYFTWAGETQIPSVLFIPVFPPSRVFGPTDGLVNVSSATWGNDLGQGTHLGTVEGLDHIAIVSIITVAATIPHLSAAENGRTAVVQPIDNNLVRSFARAFEGGINTSLAPTRAVLNLVGLRF